MTSLSILQTRKWIVLVAFICLVAFMMFSSVLMAPVWAGTYGFKQISENTETDRYPQIDNGLVVWEGYDGNDYEIWLYDTSTGEDPTPITDTWEYSRNDYNDYDPQIDNGLVVWEGYDGSHDNEIFLYDTSTEDLTRIQSDDFYDYDPQIDGVNEIVVWESRESGSDYEIWLYDRESGKSENITDNDYGDHDPQIDNGLVVWEGYDGSDNEIWLYDTSTGEDPTPITDNEYYDYDPQIDDGKVVWWQYDGNDYEIWLYDTSTENTTRITKNAYDDYYPQIDDGKVVWEGGGDPYWVPWEPWWWPSGTDSEIYLYDISTETTTQITDNAYGDYRPQIDGGKVVWTVYDFIPNLEIFLYEISTGTTEQITNNTYMDYLPQIDGGKVVWTGDEGGTDYEIFITMVDTTPPSTTVLLSGTQGNNAWWTSNVTVTLAATDTETEVANTYYSLDEGGTWSPYTTSFNITTEGNNIIYYYSVDQADPPNNETIKPETIKIDKTSPTGSVTINEGGTSTAATSVTLTLLATDATSDVVQMRFSNNGSTWTAWEPYATSKSWNLPAGDGTKTVYAQFMDSAGLTSPSTEDSIVLNTSPIGGPGYIEEALLVVAIAAIPIGILVYRLSKRPRKPPTPRKLNIQPQPAKIIADGKSKSTLTIQLLDKKGKPIAASATTEVRLKTTGGTLESPVVRIPKGEETIKTVLLSSTESGTIEVSAEAEKLESTAIKLEFEEKPRFCMGCGTRMSVKDKKCKKCGAAPEQFTGPAKICKNCERMGKTTYIPQTAEFCSECGASQPK